MANWVDVEFRKTTRNRCAQDLLSLGADILMLSDFLASLTCGTLASAFWDSRTSAGHVSSEAAATFAPEVVAGSLVLAFALRFAFSMQRENVTSPKHAAASPARRILTAIAAVMMVAAVAQIGHMSFQIWVFAWLGLLMPIVGATRWGWRQCLAVLESSGALREAVAIVGGSGARQRLAVRIASHADIVASCEGPSDQDGFLPQAEMQRLQELGRGRLRGFGRPGLRERAGDGDSEDCRTTENVAGAIGHLRR